MTMTETESAATEAADAAATPVAEPLTGLADIVTTGDHKSLGLMYVRLSLLFGLVVAAVAAIVGFENGDGASIDIFSSNDHLFQGFTFSTVGLALLVVAPLMIGLGTAIVPLQVGSTAIAFPRAAAAAFWGWLIGAGIFCGSYIIDGGFGGTESRTRPESTELTLLATAMLVTALLLALVCIVTTVVALRPTGMKLHQVPAFSWSMLVAGVMWMLSMPILLANLAIIWADMRDLDAISFGRDENIFAQISWAFSGPQAFIFAIPVLGLAADMIPVATGVRQKFYGVLVGAIAAFGVFTFGAFLQSTLAQGDEFSKEVPAFGGIAETGVRFASYNILLLLQAVLLLATAFAVFGGLADSLRIGARNVRSPQAWLLGALAALLMLLAGAAANVLRSAEPLDANGADIGFGVSYYAMLAALIGGVAGIYYWMPKLTGRRMLNAGGMLASLALLGGTVAAGLPLVINGFLKSSEIDTIEVLRLVSGVGFALVALGILLVVLDLGRISGTSSDDHVGDDPWEGHTLEWATSSPPPLANFAAPVAAVTTERPVLDMREADAEQGADA